MGNHAIPLAKAIARCVALYPLAISARLAAFPLAPVAAALADSETGRLPGWLWWMETTDHPGWDFLNVATPVQETAEKWGRRVAMARWLARNRAYALQFRLGAPKDRTWEIARWRGSDAPAARGFSCFWGVILTPHDGKAYFELQPRLTVGPYVLYLRIGWKVWGVKEGGKGGSAGMYTGFTPRTKTLENW